MRGVMMRLATNTDFAVELRIAGYQFPDNHTAKYDSNWLVIEGRVHHPSGDWTFRDPCLLTYEAAQLADWLEWVAADRAAIPDAAFIEPNLSFKVVTSETGRALQVAFGAESRPSWASCGEQVSAEFPVAGLRLPEAIGEWREQLLQYPQRAER